MSLVVARKKRTALFLSIAGLLIMAAAVSAVSARDPDGVTLRVAMVMMTVGAALWLPWQALAPAALLIWLGPNYGHTPVAQVKCGPFLRSDSLNAVIVAKVRAQTRVGPVAADRMQPVERVAEEGGR